MSSYFSTLVSAKSKHEVMLDEDVGRQEGYFGPAENLRGSRRLFDLDLVEKSGLFFEDFYLSTYPDIAQANISPLEHFFDFGYKEGRRPNFYFDPQFYVSHNPDVLESGIHPLIHYASYGDFEGRKPSITFDPSWYRKHHGLGDAVAALAHYLANCANCRFSPIPDFDVEHYARNYPDVAAAGIDPFQHFVTYGYLEGRTPSANFDTRFYRNRYLRDDASQNPFLHYLVHKHEPGVYGRMPLDEPSIPREVRKYTKRGPDFEEFAPLPASAPRRAKLLAYYLPQFHTFPENDAWWGKGFTEWTNIPRGLPRFAGHYQPRIPRDLGYYSLDQTQTMRRQVELAKAGGMYGFVFYYYWFNGKRLLDKPLDMFLEDLSIEMPFCLMWANENWTRRWDGADAEILMSQDYRPEDEQDLIADLAKHFTDPRYIRLQDRPLLMIYRPGLIANPKETLARLREEFKSKFNEDPILVMGQTFNATDPTTFGLDGAIEFPPHKLTQDMIPVNTSLQYLDIEFAGKAYRYEDVAKISLNEPKTAYPLIKTAVPSWDNDARRQGNGLVLIDSSPKKYQAWLGELIDRAVASPFFGEPIVCINAWNEWCEAAYLEPDVYYGAAYLNATGRALLGKHTEAQTGKVLLIGHDCFPSGAQHLLLNIRRTLHECFGIETNVILLDGGKLEDAYRELGPVNIVGNPAALESCIWAMKDRGYGSAIVNTSAAASAVPALKKAGLRVTLLVHELPRILKEKNLIAKARIAAMQADQLVFPAPYVRDRYSQALELKDVANGAILPQGMYQEIVLSAESAIAIREELGIAKEDNLVLAVGYADFRKGFDLFLQMWRFVRSSDCRRTHFCWVGGHDPDLNELMRQEIIAAEKTGTFHAVGYRADIAAFLAASDAFVLTSREDPFPSVVIESLYAGLPTVAFEGSGGIPDLLKVHPLGRVVPFADTVAMAKAVLEALESPCSDDQAAVTRASIAKEFDFANYVWNLLQLTVPHQLSISVAVPNFNYARHMPNRLSSIFLQTEPVKEILVLDDCSSDNSLDVIPAVAKEWRRRIRLLPNTNNSGSVFKQWRKAAETAVGEYLWIAEADDLSTPRFLSEVASLMRHDDTIKIAFTDSAAIDEHGATIWPSYKGYYDSLFPGALSKTEIFNGTEFAARFLSVRNVILNVSSVVWRRDALVTALNECENDLNTFKMAGDWRLYLQVLSVAGRRIAYCADANNIHRRHAASVTHSLDAEHHVAEIRECHKFARLTFSLGLETIKAQEVYVREISDQLSQSRITDVGTGRPIARVAGGNRSKSKNSSTST